MQQGGVGYNAFAKLMLRVELRAAGFTLKCLVQTVLNLVFFPLFLKGTRPLTYTPNLGLDTGKGLAVLNLPHTVLSMQID